MKNNKKIEEELEEIKQGVRTLNWAVILAVLFFAGVLGAIVAFLWYVFLVILAIAICIGVIILIVRIGKKLGKKIFLSYIVLPLIILGCVSGYYFTELDKKKEQIYRESYKRVEINIPKINKPIKKPITPTYEEWLKKNNITAAFEQQLCEEWTGRGPCGAYNCMDCSR